MEKIKHCQICDLHWTNIELGVYCSMTRKKPEFENTCKFIILNENLKKRIVEVNKEVENIKQSKTNVILHAIIFGSLLIMFSYGGYYFMSNNEILIIKWVENIHNFSSGASPIILFLFIPIIFIGLLAKMIGPINWYRNMKSIHFPLKKDLDKTLKFYQVTYDYKYSSNNNYFGVKNIKHTLIIKEEKFEFSDVDLVD